MHAIAENNMPTRLGAAVFSAKVAILQMQRVLHDALGAGCKRFPGSAAARDAQRSILAESTTPLWRESNSLEHMLQLGKVHNLRAAVRRLNGLQIPAGETFSFWAQVGKATRARGFVDGRELREGCLIPTVGGGLCQLSNALYDAALKAGFEIIERHSHSQVVPGSIAEQGRDATIFWNYVDLRFRSQTHFRIETHLTADTLVVQFLGTQPSPLVEPKEPPAKAKSYLSLLTVPHSAEPNSCATCGVQDCFRYIEPTKPVKGRTAYLVDEYWPEHNRYISLQKTEADTLCLPIDGGKFHKPNYAWTMIGFGEVHTAGLFTARRSIESRRLARQGAARQKALLDQQRRLARLYSDKLTYDVEHIVVAQGLLPFLWQDGVLGGRTFDVLMTALPMVRLHQRLDGAAALHRDSVTLGDFRADQALVDAETEALRHARKIITPHTEIASLFADKAELLDWILPHAARMHTGFAGAPPAAEAPTNAMLSPGLSNARPLCRPKAGAPTVVFPGATVGRKGAFEVRDAARKLKLSVVLGGPQLEGDNFWQNVSTEQSLGGDWLDQAALVVLPAFVENNPRRLLAAVASGVPVIASTACGLENVEGVITVPTGNLNALCTAIECILETGKCGVRNQQLAPPIIGNR